MAENWIESDEAMDVAGSIRHVIRVSQFVEQDPLAWKWVMLALHSALQGACVCHLTTTAAPVGAVTETNAGKWLKYFEERRNDQNAKRPKTFLMAFPDLLSAVRSPHSARDRSNAAGVAISDTELCWLRSFHDEIRNQFVHFEPMGWSIEVSGIPEIAKLVARIIGAVVELGWAFRHLSPPEIEELQRNLQTLSLMEWPA